MGIESSRKGPEQEKKETLKETFERGKCIDASFKGFQVSIVVSMSDALARDFEQRYIPEEISEDKPQFGIRIPLVEERVQRRIAQLSARNSEGSLSNPTLQAMQEKINHETKGLGNSLLGRAAELGLAATETVEEVAERLKFPGSLEHDVEYDNGVLQSQDWRLYTTQDDEQVLVIPHQTADKIEEVSVVSVEQLYAEDPTIVKEQILKFHELQQVDHAISNVTYGLAIHEKPQADVIPQWLEQFNNGTPDDVREADDLVWYLNFIRSTTDPARPQIEQFLDRLRFIKQPISGSDDRRVDVSGYLNHMKDCDSEPDAVRQRAAAIKGTYDQFTKKDYKVRDQPKKFPNSYISGLINPQDFSSVDDFIEEHNIPRDALVQLAGLSRWVTDPGPDTRSYGEVKGFLEDYSTFTICFNTLYLSAHGAIDVTSPRFRAVTREVFPQVTDEMLDVIQIAHLDKPQDPPKK